jgi:ribosomal protein S18 acetylase RimI-like enzyme
VRLRAATKDDAVAVALIHANGDLLTIYGDALDSDALARLHSEKAALWEALLAKPPAGQSAFVAEDRHVVGFASAGPDLDNFEEGKVFALFVERAAWGRGLGSHLLAAAERHLQARFANAGLWVVESNIRAQRLYERRGWRPTEEDKRQHGVRFMRYKKRLRGEARGSTPAHR